MNNFEIQDAQRLLSQVGDLVQINQNITYLRGDLDTCINQINNAWQSDTADKESYMAGIQKNNEKIRQLNEAIFSLADKLQSFAEQSIRTANNG